jgi:hypothetical protein
MTKATGSSTGERPATLDDPPCSCGRPAHVVYLTPKGEVPYCGVPNAVPLPERVTDQRWRDRWGWSRDVEARWRVFPDHVDSAGWQET